MTAANMDPAPSKGSMLRILGVTFGIAVTLRNTIGSGIMRIPSQIANRLPSVPLIMLAWALGAVYSLLRAWSLAEMGSDDPEFGCLLHRGAASLWRLGWIHGGLDRLDRPVQVRRCRGDSGGRVRPGPPALP